MGQWVQRRTMGSKQPVEFYCMYCRILPILDVSLSLEMTMKLLKQLILKQECITKFLMLLYNIHTGSERDGMDWIG